ncbi:MAG: NAD kinase [Bacteroidetes bacterium HGW-Bacteroidetes-21]|jgi:NAD+ kinase|nr:MAG: NAD kinase [Bacteroidetes bacterium HGW-Bacteroidetes-21]
MKKIAFYGRNIPDDFKSSMTIMLQWIKSNKLETYVYHSFFESLHQLGFTEEMKVKSTFTGHQDMPKGLDAVFCIGGDGTFLEAVSLVKDAGIPLIGINSGRLGFLANITIDELPTALDLIQEGEFVIEERSLLQLKSDQFSFPGYDSALNEFTVYKRDSSSMISIKTSINGVYLNTYWADGLIISTPTGSTAYSLSVGGPILAPDSNVFVLSPIAPHNMTVRPLVVSNESEITLIVESRSGNCMVSLDHHSCTIDSGIELHIRKADYKINMIRLKNQNFYNTLRQKLMWGADKRN